MKIHHILLFGFLSAVLCGGNTGLVSAKLSIFTGPEGGDGTIQCLFSSSGTWKFFCKDQCTEKGILLKTDGLTATNGRYSIKYESESSGKMFLSVGITNLTQSDSGRYKAGVGPSSGPDSYCEYEARVSHELLDKNSGFIWTNIEGENFTFPCNYDVDRGRFFFCRDDCKKEEDVLIETDQKKAQSGRYGVEYDKSYAYGLSVTITHMKTSDTGRYKCGYGRASSPDSSRTFSVIVTEDPTTLKSSQTLRPSPTSLPSSSNAATTAAARSSSNVPHTGPVLPLVVCVPIVGLFLSAVSLLMFYKWKKKSNLVRNTSRRTNKEVSLIYENWDSAPASGDNIYQNFDPAEDDKGQFTVN
ncbi:hypothetical protein Q5P01_007117 [Channa striata]|uniref:Immunoglobulin domain-containing protein n=1 Tax=Channa striata TaxID=64152 RepID=A0AA88SW28_CHASR|nr:hypothetical protein Q5P01_007117 [Channa striata]